MGDIFLLYIIISLDHWVRLDEQPPTLYKLIINGAFDVVNDPSTDFTLEATYIIIDGIFNVGMEDDPFVGNFTLSLHGDALTPDYRSTVDEEIDGPLVGNKAMGKTSFELST